MRLEAKSRMESRTTVFYLGGIWRQLEPLKRIYGRFPSVDPSYRFATLGKPYIERKNRLQPNPFNDQKSAHGPHKRDVTHILDKVSCFLLKSFHFPRLQKR